MTVRFTVRDYSGNYVMITDLHRFTGRFEAYAFGKDDSIILVNDIQLAFGKNCNHIEVMREE